LALKDFKEDREYLNANHDKLMREHKDEFIVVQNKRVVSCGKELQEVLAEARGRIGDAVNDSIVEYLSTRKTEMVV
jgi:hypothetical protein